MPQPSDHLRSIHNFNELVQYLEDKLGWPLQEYGFDDLTFQYDADELGLKEDDAAKVKAIHQLRPLQHGQPWGIFFVEFEKKKLPVVVLRRILSHLVVKKRASANRANEAAWHSEDLLFVTAFGEEDSAQREIAFAHFHQSPGDLPTLRVLGWDGDDTPLKLAHVDAVLRERLCWPDNPNNHAEWRTLWSKAFRNKLGHTVTTAKELAQTLANLAGGIRKRCKIMMAAESEKGPLRKIYKSFQEALIHELTEHNFATYYAETITYGLFTAAVSRTDYSDGKYGTFVVASNVADMVPITNPFLKDMLHAFLEIGGRKDGFSFDELGFQDVVEFLRSDATDLPSIIRDFGNKNPNEDPVIRLYEDFLLAFDQKLRKDRGVYYTPKPVVSYIVRSVDELLKTEFGLDDGLASTVTWGEMAQKNIWLKIPKGISPDSPFVMILDPSTGTATFLVEVIDVIHKAMITKWQKQGKREQEFVSLWNDYVPKHLLPRMYGYELMMAPYAIAHMKIGLKLFETGYQFLSDARVRVYLTNALEPASDEQQKFVGILPALAQEAQAVNAVKRNVRFTVVLGNPPYAVNSSNKNSPIDAHLSAYKERLNDERNLKPLNDDYVKFFRCSQMQLELTNIGVLGLITNHSFATARLFRSMRSSLLKGFKKILFLDLRGESSRDPLLAIDQNVFDIQQGVGINLFVINGKMPIADSTVKVFEIIGSRSDKYSWLNSNIVSSTPWIPVVPRPDLYSLSTLSESIDNEYKQLLPVNQLFINGNVGYQTHRDDFVIDFEKGLLKSRLDDFKNSKCNPDEIAERFGVRNNGDWDISIAHKTLNREESVDVLIQKTLYRPFDVRYIFYAPYMIDRDRRDLMQHMTSSNVGLLISKVFDEHEFTSVLATRFIVESKAADRTRGSYLFPLRQKNSPNQANSSGQYQLDVTNNNVFSSNMRKEHVTRIAQSLGMQARQMDSTATEKNISDIDVFNYMYSIFHCPGYRIRYAEFLKIDFPRIPITSNLGMFRSLGKLGGELVALHLLESPTVNNFITTFTGKGDNSIPKKPTWKDNAVWINPTQRFEGVPENVWNFHIGGYQVCEKWIKDRKGRTLSDDDITHYQRIVISLSETIRIMAEIDEVIDEHGGWPIK